MNIGYEKTVVNDKKLLNIFIQVIEIPDHFGG